MLTLPQQLYLLNYDVDKGKLTGSQFRGHLVRAAALTQLTIDGQLTDARGKASRTSAGPPADGLLRSVLDEIPDDSPRSWRRLVGRRRNQADAAVRGQLADLGAIRVRDRRILGLFPAPVVTVPDTAQVTVLRETARDAVLSDRPPSAVTTNDAALAVLAAAGEVGPVFSRGERRTYKHRIRELGDELGGAAPALRQAIQAIRAATAAAAASAAASGAGS